MKIIFSLFLVLVSISCVEDDDELGETLVPSNLEVTFEVVGQTPETPHGDGSGEVKFKASADNANTYKFDFGDGAEVTSVDGETTHSYSATGVNNFTVTVVASGTGGTSSNITTVVTVFREFEDPATKQLLTGGNSKTWFVAAAEVGHLGVGPATGGNFTFPEYYAAPPFDKSGSPCFYKDELTFSLEEDDIVYNYDNKGATLFHNSYNTHFGGGGPDDQCLPFDGSGQKSVSFSPSVSELPENETTGTVLNISGGGFMSFYVGASSFEILEITPTFMHVRTIQANDPALAWYLKFSTTAVEAPEPVAFVTEYEDLLKAYEFDTDGPPDPEEWSYDIGTGDNGWGNAESQYYTDDNVIIENGNLVITAKAENINGAKYSSSRIKTKDNFEFTYGRVEARAKLPEGAGTWPAIWMLGSNFEEVGWPGTGEIDLMEHVGNRQNEIHGTLHYPGRSGGNADGNSTIIENASSEFHIYTVEWSPERIWFLVDGEVYHQFVNSPASPFNKNFFLILNVAMGGTFGGNIDPSFSESSMEVDYIRVYQ